MRIGAYLGACALLVAGTACAQETDQRAEIIKGDPKWTGERYEIQSLPRPKGPARALFNGRDLTGWEAWLGYADTALTFRGNPGATPLGTSVNTAEIFSVESVDGGPVIRAGGRYWGSLATLEEFADYHLSLEYRWGGLEPGQQRNNGVVYFSHGNPGGVFGTWRAGVEFQLQLGNNGMAIPMGNMIRTRTNVAQDPGIEYPHRRFWFGGREIDLANGNPAYSVGAAVNAEKPIGEWNRIDLYVVGNQAIHVVNGVVVMFLRDVAEIDAAGKRVPLMRGRIQLQAEGATTYFRNIRIEQIGTMPRFAPAQ
ncbi:DUF1080 domain-containing protein [Sphingomonas sp. LB-2]|uniref:3-keto-disaccharide hydrolase n=1 Tax=Sphingomonas caeni TaxID=2984949 RepID=UPI00222E429B|nr:DUF1080 domain-containing protein [Sphingomonas caeni]MCW3846084.1 DUF1080 domain-containing protein [Sphingomonas caeni]